MYFGFIPQIDDWASVDNETLEFLGLVYGDQRKQDSVKPPQVDKPFMMPYICRQQITLLQTSVDYIGFAGNHSNCFDPHA